MSEAHHGALPCAPREPGDSLHFSDGFAEAHGVLVACFFRLNPKGNLGSAESPSADWGSPEQAGMLYKVFGKAASWAVFISQLMLGWDPAV